MAKEHRLERELRIGPDLSWKNHTVFIEGFALGEFEKPWEAVAAIRKGLRKWADSMTKHTDPNVVEGHCTECNEPESECECLESK